MKNENESKIQQEIVQYFRKTYCLPDQKPRLIIMSVPNGIGLTVPPAIRPIVNKAIAVAIELMKQIGLTVGAADLQAHGMYGRVIHIEVKTSTGSQSSDQIKFQKRIEDLQGVYILVRSLPDFQEKIKPHIEWLRGN